MSNLSMIEEIDSIGLVCGHPVSENIGILLLLLLGTSCCPEFSLALSDATMEQYGMFVCRER